MNTSKRNCLHEKLLSKVYAPGNGQKEVCDAYEKVRAQETICAAKLCECLKEYQFTVEDCPHCNSSPLPQLKNGRLTCNLCGNIGPVGLRQLHEQGF